MALTWDKIQTGVVLVSQLQTFPIFCAYILMVLLAPQWKKISAPLNLRMILIVYNLSASAVSVYTLLGFTYGLYTSESSFQKTPSATLKPIYKVYWLMKIFELLDTVFMILRHKQRQISFLHVYHHGSMLILSDLAYAFYPYPAIAVYLALNSAVHVLLYLYYGLSALYPDNPPPWKKFMTQFQLAQFFIDLIHASIGYLYHGYCIYGILYGLVMVWLFSNFYYHAYIRKKSSHNGAIRENDVSIKNGVVNGLDKKSR